MNPIKCLATIAASGLLLAACGGVGGNNVRVGYSTGGGPIVSVPADEPLRPEQYSYKETRPPDLLSLAGQAPTTYLDASRSRWNRRVLNGSWQVGGDVAPLSGETDGCHAQSLARRCGSSSGHELPTIRHHDETAIFYGKIRDGVGKYKVVQYLQAMASSWFSGHDAGLFTLQEPPVVRLADGTSYEHRRYVVRALQIINSALPHEWKIRIDDEPVSVGFRKNGNWPDRGEIIVEFARVPESESGATFRVHADWTGDEPRNIGGDVLIDPYRAWKDTLEVHNHELASTRLDQEQITVGILVHEILHGLGGAHLGMLNGEWAAKSNMGKSHDFFGTPGHILYMWDREALLAAYSRLEPGTRPEDIDKNLGLWSDTSLHVKGNLAIADGEIAFGAAHRNGFVSPWANGPTPSAYLAGSAAPSGSAGWSGRLLGLTPNAEAVGGAARLTVRLETLDGDLDFTRLESWLPDAAPGAVGTGKRWQSGSLHYDIGVRGNTFVQTGGDVGTVTGVFFGRSHEGMGGVLERDDLVAGFGGQRFKPGVILEETGRVSMHALYDEMPWWWREAWRERLAYWEYVWQQARPKSFHSYHGWGFWATLDGETLFKTVLYGDGVPGIPCHPAAECAPSTRNDLRAVTDTGTPTGSNPEIGAVTWTGYARGVSSSGLPMTGKASLEADLDSGLIDVHLTELGELRNQDLSWTELVMQDGAFGRVDESEEGWIRSSIEGAFYGPNHESAAGQFRREYVVEDVYRSELIVGVFGALRTDADE